MSARTQKIKEKYVYAKRASLRDDHAVEKILNVVKKTKPVRIICLKKFVLSTSVKILGMLVEMIPTAVETVFVGITLDSLEPAIRKDTAVRRGSDVQIKMIAADQTWHADS